MFLKRLQVLLNCCYALSPRVAASETPAVDSRAILTPQEEEDLVKIILLADDSPDDEAKTRPELRDLIVDMLRVRLKQTRRGRETYRGSTGCVGLWWQIAVTQVVQALLRQAPRLD